MKLFDKINKVLGKIFGTESNTEVEAEVHVESEEASIAASETPETSPEPVHQESVIEVPQQATEVAPVTLVAEETTVEPAPSVEVIDASSEADISVEVKVHAPADAKVHVTVNVDQSVEEARKKRKTDQSAEARRRKRRKRRRWDYQTPGIDYWCSHEGEGIKLNSHTKYLAVNADKELILDHSELKALESQFLDDLEVCYGADFFADDEPFGTAPTSKQVNLYYGLCRQCEDAGLDYNRKDRPMTYREYQLAIMALCRALRIPQKVARTANL